MYVRERDLFSSFKHKIIAVVYYHASNCFSLNICSNIILYFFWKGIWRGKCNFISIIILWMPCLLFLSDFPFHSTCVFFCTWYNAVQYVLFFKKKKNIIKRKNLKKLKALLNPEICRSNSRCRMVNFDILFLPMNGK